MTVLILTTCWFFLHTRVKLTTKAKSIFLTFFNYYYPVTHSLHIEGESPKAERTSSEATGFSVLQPLLPPHLGWPNLMGPEGEQR